MKTIAEIICPFFFILGLGAIVLYILVMVNDGNIGIQFALGGLLSFIFGLAGTAYSQGWNKKKTLGVLLFHLF